MNKAEVIAKVSEQSGVPADVCGKLVGALEKVLQDELGAKGGMGALGKIAGILNLLTSEKKS